MIVYGRDKSTKLPRKTPKRTKPGFRDAFPTYKPNPIFRSDMGQQTVPSAIDAFLRTSDSRLSFPRHDERLGWLDELESGHQGVSSNTEDEP
jgi:hypothetical protein